MEDERIARELTEVPWCPLRCKGTVRHFVKCCVSTGSGTSSGSGCWYALAVTDLVRVWVCGASGGVALASELAQHNPHLECTPARAAALLEAAMRRNTPREALGSSGGVTFSDEETPLMLEEEDEKDSRGVEDDDEKERNRKAVAAQTTFALSMNKRLAGYTFRWCFTCHPFGLCAGQTHASVAQVAAAQLMQAEFLRAQLLEPVLRTAAIAQAALHSELGTVRALEVPKQAEEYVAGLSADVVGAQPCTGALVDALYRRCVSGVALMPGRVVAGAVHGGTTTPTQEDNFQQHQETAAATTTHE